MEGMTKSHLSSTLERCQTQSCLEAHQYSNQRSLSHSGVSGAMHRTLLRCEWPTFNCHHNSTSGHKSQDHNSRIDTLQYSTLKEKPGFQEYAVVVHAFSFKRKLATWKQQLFSCACGDNNLLLLKITAPAKSLKVLASV